MKNDFFALMHFMMKQIHFLDNLMAPSASSTASSTLVALAMSTLLSVGYNFPKDLGRSCILSQSIEDCRQVKSWEQEEAEH